ncbi:hypothetical protein PP175_14510 [Aneurinibacillus sp. Ricciae_BoGa-3]|uniref:hypothetical protein n=1 Tax=Aneurinibacillus sp. Ricciae_BoGa-3 TaxID=3022697 RepID=UPI0023404417|nr:hypothetical protein [Aneurinibacillus sp. Ricciae_BoGa-3]WCK52643.1 hypothetical protein PP175_14510 [Aneurinibacillus sp. Ricciae_BoGa-3]
MAMGLVKKLLIKKGFRLHIENAPENFTLPTEELPEEVQTSNQLDGDLDFVLLFAHNQAELVHHVPFKGRCYLLGCLSKEKLQNQKRYQQGPGMGDFKRSGLPGSQPLVHR